MLKRLGQNKEPKLVYENKKKGDKDFTPSKENLRMVDIVETMRMSFCNF